MSKEQVREIEQALRAIRYALRGQHPFPPDTALACRIVEQTLKRLKEAEDGS